MLLRTASKLLRGMQVAGHDVQGKKFQPFANDTTPLQNTDRFPFAITTTNSGTFLGVKVELLGGKIRIRCDSAERYRKASAQLTLLTS
jgi:hypothetical protein